MKGMCNIRREVMKKKIVGYLIMAAVAATLVGCNSGKNADTATEPVTEAVEEATETAETSETATETETVNTDEGTEETALEESVIASMNDLYAMQLNYSNGTATLNIIPTTTVEAVYDNWDVIETSDIAEAPISLREYVDPSIVYFDYESGYSVKWNKDEHDVTIEETNIQDREDYKQKQHKE